MRLCLLAAVLLSLAACTTAPVTPVDPTAAAVAYQVTVISLQDTRSASDLAATVARATAEVIRLQSTAAYLVQYSQAMSTGTAVIENREIAEKTTAAAARRGRSWRALGLFLGWGLGLLLLAFCVMLIHVLWLRGMAQAANMRAAYMPTPSQPTPDLLPASLPAENGHKEVTDFLYQSAVVLGRDSMRLPRYDALQGWSAERWTLVTDHLVKCGAVVKVSGRGSYVREPYRTINGLYQAITTGRLVLPPLPAGGVSRFDPPNGEQNANGDLVGGWQYNQVVRRSGDGE